MSPFVIIKFANGPRHSAQAKTSGSCYDKNEIIAPFQYWSLMVIQAFGRFIEQYARRRTISKSRVPVWKKRKVEPSLESLGSTRGNEWMEANSVGWWMSGRVK